jgi:hypothetical protein
LQESIPKEKLIGIRNDNLATEFQEDITAIAEGLDIWKGDDERCRRFQEHFKLRLGAQPSQITTMNAM